MYSVKQGNNELLKKLARIFLIAFILIGIILSIVLPITLRDKYTIPENSERISIDQYKSKYDNREDFVLFIGYANNQNSNYLLRGSRTDKNISNGQFSYYAENTELPVYIMEGTKKSSFDSTLENMSEVFYKMIPNIDLEGAWTQTYQSNAFWFGDYYSGIYDEYFNIEYTNIDFKNGYDFDLNSDGLYNYQDYIIYYDLIVDSKSNLDPQENYKEQSNLLNSESNHYIMFDISYGSCEQTVENKKEETEENKESSSETAHVVESKQILLNNDLQRNYVQLELYPEYKGDNGKVLLKNPLCFNNTPDANRNSSDEAYKTNRNSSEILGTRFFNNSAIFPMVMWFGTKPDNEYGLKGMTTSYTLLAEGFVKIENFLYQ